MAGEWDIDARDAFRVAAELTETGAKAGSRALAVTRHFGLLLQTRVKANASGRPGPRAITGDYRRSVSTTSGGDSGDVYADVGTNKPQGRRLEFGFHGTDSIGRRFNQAPLPHFGPALDKIGPDYTEAIAAIVDTA